MVIRGLRPSDIAFAFEQTRREGWESSPEVFGLHLDHDPKGCFIAEEAGQRVGLVTTTAFLRTGWIGNLIVLPEARGTGLGSRLMEHAIGHLASRGLATLRLEADPLGVNIYRRLEFVDEFASPRFCAEAVNASVGTPCAPLSERDLAAVAAYDAPRFGDDRSRVLRHLLALSQAAYRVPARGAIAGYVMVQPSTSGVRIGPWVADDIDAASELLHAALDRARGRRAIVALPGVNDAGQALLTSSGFAPAPPSLRMVRGPAGGAGRPACIFGLASGAFG